MRNLVLCTLAALFTACATDTLAQSTPMPVLVKIRTEKNRDLDPKKIAEGAHGDGKYKGKEITTTINFVADFANPKLSESVENLSLKLYVVEVENTFSDSREGISVREVFEKKDIRVKSREQKMTVELGATEFKKSDTRSSTGGWQRKDGTEYKGYVCEVFHNNGLVGTLDFGGKGVRDAVSQYKANPPEEDEEEEE
jgi:hypothetical protein